MGSFATCIKQIWSSLCDVSTESNVDEWGKGNHQHFSCPGNEKSIIYIDQKADWFLKVLPNDFYLYQHSLKKI